MDQEIQNAERLLELDPDNPRLQQRVDAIYARHGLCQGCQNSHDERYECCRKKLATYPEWTRARASVASRIGKHLIRIGSTILHEEDIISTNSPVDIGLTRKQKIHCGLRMERIGREQKYVNDTRLTVFESAPVFRLSTVVGQGIKNYDSEKLNNSLCYRIMSIYDEENILDPTFHMFPFQSKRLLHTPSSIFGILTYRLAHSSNQIENLYDNEFHTFSRSLFLFMDEKTIDEINSIISDKSTDEYYKFDKLQEISKYKRIKESFDRFDKSMKQALVADLHLFKRVIVPSELSPITLQRYVYYYSLSSKLTSGDYEDHYRKLCERIINNRNRSNAASIDNISMRSDFSACLVGSINIGHINQETISLFLEAYEALPESIIHHSITNDDILILDMLSQNKERSYFALPFLERLRENSNEIMRQRISNVEMTIRDSSI